MHKLNSNISTEERSCITPVNLKLRDACITYSRGQASMIADASAAQAIIRLGRSVLIYAPKMNEYYASLAGE